MRGILLGLATALGTLVVLVGSLFIGMKNDSGLVFAICLAVGIFILVKACNAGGNLGRIKMDSWLSSVANCDFKYAWDGSGIALDTTIKQIHLVAHIKKQLITRIYPISDIREWGYEMPGTTNISGRNVVGNVALAFNAIENTGFWLKVKDIDHPKWFIKFKCKSSQDKETEKELLRWMEILNQNVNG